MRKFIYLFILLLLVSCKKTSPTNDLAIVDSTLSIQYAQGFKIDYYKDYKKVTVIDPWNNNSIFATYYLTNSENKNVPNDGIKIITPINKIGAASGTHYEFLELINELSSITGICSSNKIFHKKILAKIQKKELVDMGNPFQLNIETILMLNPDAVMVSGFNQEDLNSKRLINNGVPVIYNNEWMEKSLLARAEWIKFVGVFYNKEKLADSIFNVISTKYEKLKKLVTLDKIRPSVMVGGNFKGTWYMPGGKSYMAGLIKDAGGTYYYQNNLESGSLPLNFEVVLTNFKDADIWIACPANSINELTEIDKRHLLFKAAKNKNIFNFNNRTTSSGGNDFWESAVAYPDILLKDMIKVMHPELMNDHDFYYIAHLNE